MKKQVVIGLLVGWSTGFLAWKVFNQGPIIVFIIGFVMGLVGYWIPND